jgi:hypothetical protein
MAPSCSVLTSGRSKGALWGLSYNGLLPYEPITCQMLYFQILEFGLDLNISILERRRQKCCDHNNLEFWNVYLFTHLRVSLEIKYSPSTLYFF